MFSSHVYEKEICLLALTSGLCGVLATRFKSINSHKSNDCSLTIKI